MPARRPNPAHATSLAILWAAWWINAAMFVVELVCGWRAGSVSLLADAIDFFGDAVNYGVSLAVLGLSLAWRAQAAALKGLTMGALALSAAWSVPRQARVEWQAAAASR